jgi:Predicted signal transduction protein with a C-terminal ATPase domain
LKIFIAITVFVRKFFEGIYSVLCKYTNLSLKKKFFIFNFIIVALVCAVSQLAIKSALNIYDNILYDQAAQVLNLSTSMIESEFKRIDGISLNIVSDQKVQQYVAQIKYGNDAYDNYVAKTEMINKLFTYVASEKAISSVHFLDTEGNQYYDGNYLLRLTDDAKDIIKRKALYYSGNSIIIGPIDNDPSVISAREIRAVQGFSLDSMGTIVMRVDMQRLVNKYLSSLPKKDFDFLVFSDNSPIYISNKANSKDMPLSSLLNSSKDGMKSIYSQLALKFTGSDGYIFYSINNKKFFIAYTKSSYTGWTYINAIPYDSIFTKVSDMSNALTAVFVTIFLITLLLSLYFAGNITRPLENLTRKMKKVEEGNFELQEETQSVQRIDEIGQLNNDFDIMICKINSLIKEDYTKQIILKDAQYKALQSQINPHFLYNTLDSINWMAKLSHENNISLMVESLGNLLRSTISNKEYIISLGQEIEILNYYINIQKIRFEDRLDFRMEIDGRYDNVKIPKLILQPIVENSINYGLENMMGTCIIRLFAYENEGAFEVVIEDNGPGIDEDILQKIEKGQVPPKGLGVGLKNIDDRIRIIFGENHGICINSKNGQGTSVHICIPIETGD